MSTVTITGTFKNSNNSTVVIDVYQPTAGGFEFKRSFTDSFDQTFNDLPANAEFIVNFYGNTTGSFDLNITGDVKNNFSKSYTGSFLDDVNFETT